MIQAKALIFDFNGVIIDDEPLHARLSQQVLQDEGLMLTWKDYQEIYLGFDDKGLFKAVYLREGRELSTDKLSALITKKNQLYQQALAKNLPLFEGVTEFILSLQGHYLLAIVSGALRQEIELVLDQAGLANIFPVIISAEDTIECKPHPEGYLKALALLREQSPNLSAKDCLAIEDSHAGIQSAKSAGMQVAAVAHTYSANTLSSADYVVESIAGLDRIIPSPKSQETQSQRAEELFKFVVQAQKFQKELNPISIRCRKAVPEFSLKRRLKKLSGKN